MDNYTEKCRAGFFKNPSQSYSHIKLFDHFGVKFDNGNFELLFGGGEYLVRPHPDMPNCAIAGENTLVAYRKCTKLTSAHLAQFTTIYILGMNTCVELENPRDKVENLITCYSTCNHQFVQIPPARNMHSVEKSYAVRREVLKCAKGAEILEVLSFRKEDPLCYDLGDGLYNSVVVLDTHDISGFKRLPKNLTHYFMTGNGTYSGAQIDHLQVLMSSLCFNSHKPAISADEVLCFLSLMHCQVKAVKRLSILGFRYGDFSFDNYDVSSLSRCEITSPFIGKFISHWKDTQLVNGKLDITVEADQEPVFQVLNKLNEVGYDITVRLKFSNSEFKFSDKGLIWLSKFHPIASFRFIVKDIPEQAENALVQLFSCKNKFTPEFADDSYLALPGLALIADR